jgi:hypothetical protein
VGLPHLAIRTQPFRGAAMSKSDNGSPPNRTSSVQLVRTIYGNLPFRPKDLRHISGHGPGLRGVDHCLAPGQAIVEDVPAYFGTIVLATACLSGFPDVTLD